MSYMALGGMVVGGLVGAGGAALAGKRNMYQPELFHPKAFDLSNALSSWQSIVKGNWGDATQMASAADDFSRGQAEETNAFNRGQASQTNAFNRGQAAQTNAFNLNQALKDYTTIQPDFTAIQKTVGDNALSFAKGELPADVVSSIGRAAASQGIQNGFAGGNHTGTSFIGNGAATSLDLRNLGVSSLDLAQMGTNLGMQVNSQAKALSPDLVNPGIINPGIVSPVLSSPMSFLPGLDTALNIGMSNNNDLNSANLSNIAALNKYEQEKLDADYAYRMQIYNGAMSGMKAGSSMGGGGMGGGGGGMGGMMGGMMG
jgi:hypothetical protein